MSLLEIILIVIAIMVAVILINRFRSSSDFTANNIVSHNIADENEIEVKTDEIPVITQDGKIPIMPDSEEYNASLGVYLISEWKRKELWDGDIIRDPYEIYTYCLIAFDNSGKTFWYRTRNPYIEENDIVVVPVGKKYDQKLGKVVFMGEYYGDEVPFPLDGTKQIIGRADLEKINKTYGENAVI